MTTYSITATLELDGSEADFDVRANVVLESNAGPGGWGATFDGPIEAKVGREWIDLDKLEIDVRTRNGIEESLSQVAFDDADEGPDPGDRDE